MDTLQNEATKQKPIYIYPGETSAPILRFAAWFVFAACLLSGLAITHKNSEAETIGIILIFGSAPIALILDGLGAVLENVIQLRKDQKKY